MRQQFGMALAKFRIAVEQHLADLVVGQAGMRVHHRLEEARPEQLAFVIEIQLGGHTQAVDLGIQRTQAVRQHLGQHRDDPVGEVHRVTAPIGLLVECRTRRDVGRYVGDCDQQTPTLLGTLAEHRVVEVARIGAIDRDQRGAAQVDAATLGDVRNLRRQVVDLPEQGIGPCERDVVGADRNIGRHARRQVIAEDLDDLAERLPPRLGVLGDMHHDHLAMPGAHQAVRRDQDLLCDALVVGKQERDTGLDLHPSDDVFEGTLEHLHHGRLPPPAPVDAGYPCNDAVAVPQSAHLARTEEQVVAALVGLQETEAVRMTDNPTVNEILVVDHAVTTAPVAHHLTIARHGVQPSRQGILLLRIGQFERRCQVIERQRSAVFLHQAEDELAARDRIGVLLGLAGLVGVTVPLRTAGSASGQKEGFSL